jgi:ribosomal protein L40E
MRVVRCDSCGAKAMIAAGQCPKCGHLFELRDGFGELLPLAYCSSCDSYYPETVGSCRWCGTKPERPPIWPQVFRGVAVAGAVAIVGTAWLLHDSSPKEPVRARRAAATKVAATPAPRVDTVVPVPPPLPASASADSVVQQAAIASPDPLPREAVPAYAAPPAPAPAVESKPIPTKSGATTSRQTRRWVRSVSRDWVVVRAGASKKSRIIASIGPRSRVELGETVGSWRRIRMRGLNGWVEPRNSFELLASR